MSMVKFSPIALNFGYDFVLWGWLCKTVMSLLTVLPVQLFLFLNFHLRNSEIYSLVAIYALFVTIFEFAERLPTSATLH